MTIKKSELRISRKEVRIILRYLEDHNSVSEEFPIEGYKPFNGVTRIIYGYMGCKSISVEKIEYIAKRIGAKAW